MTIITTKNYLWPVGAPELGSPNLGSQAGHGGLASVESLTPTPGNATGDDSGAPAVAISTMNGQCHTAAESSPAGLSGARLSLHHANIRLAAASTALAAARRPPDRLNRIIADADLARADLDAARSTDQEVLGTWLREGMPGGPGSRPGPSRALLHCEDRVCATAADADAARLVLASAEADAQRAAEAVNAAAHHRDEALKAALLGEVQRVSDQQLAPAIAHVLAAEKRLRDIEDHFQASGDFATAAAIREMISRSKTSVGIPKSEPHLGKQFCAALLVDAAAELAA